MPPRRGKLRPGHSLGAFLAGSLVFMAVSLWLMWPRFSIHGPALIDDWYEIRWSGFAFRQLTHVAFDPTVYDNTRFRPGMWLSAWVRWHVFGGPSTMLGPNLWNIARIWMFGIGLAAVVIVAIRPAARARLGTGWLIALCALPGLAVVCTPGLITDFARLVPQEPMLLGGSAVGLVALLYALHLTTGSPGRAGRLAIAALGFAGACFWAFGVAQKEASITFVCLAPFVLIELRERWPAAERPGRVPTAVVAAVLLVPLAYMFIGTAGISSHHTLIYGSSTPSGVGGWISRLATATRQQWGFFSFVPGGVAWQGACEALPLLAAWLWIRQRRPPWIALGLSALALAMLAFQGIPLTFAPRYLEPVCALVAIGFAVIAAESPAWMRAVLVTAGTLFVIVGVRASHTTVSQYATSQRQGTQLVDAVSALSPDECPVYLVNIDVERRDSLPELIALHGEPNTPCPAQYQAEMVNLPNNPYLAGGHPGVTNDSLLNACAAPGWQQIKQTALAVIDGCAKLDPIVPQSSGTTLPIATVLSEDRIIVPAAPYARGVS